MAKPKLKKAVDALDTLKREDIAELKSSKLEGIIKDLFECVMILLEKPTSLESIKKTYTDASFIKVLRDLEPKQIK